METNVKFNVEVDVQDKGLSDLTKTTNEAKNATVDLTNSQKKNTEQSNKQDKAINKLGGGVKNLAGIVGKIVLAYASFNALVVDAIRKSQQQNKSERLLANQITKTGRSLGLTTEQINKQITATKEITSALQEKLAIGDEELNQASTWFTRQGANAEMTERLLELSADLAVSTGDDLYNASKDVSEAMHDATGSLESFRQKGIAFTTSEEDMIRTLQENNRQVEAQEFLLNKLEKTFGGNAKKMADSWEGTYQKFINVVGDFQESLGLLWQGISAQPLEDLKNIFSDLIEVFKSDAAKDMTVTISGIVGAIKALGSIALNSLGITDFFNTLSQSIASGLDSIDEFISGLSSLSKNSAESFGSIVLGAKALGESINYIGTSWLQLAKTIATGLLNPKNAKKEWDKYIEISEKGGAKAWSSIKKAFDSKEAERIGREAANKISMEYKKSAKHAAKTIRPMITKAFTPDTKEVGKVVSQLVRDNAKYAMKGVNEAFNMINSIGNASFNLSDSLGLPNFNKELQELDTNYNKLLENITNKEVELEEQRIAQEEAEQERKEANLEAELNRLNAKSGAYLTAEEKKKLKELETQKALLADEKKRAQEEKKLAKEKEDLEKELADKKAEIEYQQAMAEWTNEKSAFEANKQMQIFQSSAAIAKAPVEATLAILAETTRSGPIGAAVMTPIALGLAGSVISSAIQLASAANQSFSSPQPIKSLYTGGSVSLDEGSSFMIGGRMGYEEQATVRGNRLFVDNSLMTEKRPSSKDDMNIIIQNINIQANNPEDFLDQLKDIVRDERYK